MDEIKIYNYVRSPAQIAWDYNRGKPVAYYKLDECTGSAIHSSGNSIKYDSSLDGTITIGGSEARRGILSHVS
jgi:hypothetical protein